MAQLWCRKSPQGREIEAWLHHAMTGKPSSKLVHFLNQGRIRQRKERDGLRLSSAVSKM